MALMAITHNILIVLPEELFYKAFLTPFVRPLKDCSHFARSWATFTRGRHSVDL